MVSVPTGSAVVLKLALPPLRVAVPRTVVPTLNVTVPVGVPKPDELGATVAVKVTDWPNTEDVGAAVTEVVVLPELTVSVVVPLLVVKLVSPL